MRRRWNLEDWLPPVEAKRECRDIYGRSSRRNPRITGKIEFDEGRVNFKEARRKGVRVHRRIREREQVSQGAGNYAWRRNLRSGVRCNHGDPASAGSGGHFGRLQPARIQLHWAERRLRIYPAGHGNDPGVRGEFAVDGMQRGQENPAMRQRGMAI